MKYALLLLIGMTLLSCSDTTESSVDCDFDTIISQEEFKSATSDAFTIKHMAIVGDCLKISIGASGCDGNTWQIKLIDSEAIMKSLPIQRNLKISFKNGEECLAVITKEVSFDISKLRVQGKQVQLNIVDTDQSILYQY